jgi:hypothetical protein
MDHPGTDLFADLQRCIESFGVRVLLKEMDIERPGEFDGLTITINPRHDHESACYYLAHSFGSIVQWSTDYERAQKVFDEHPYTVFFRADVETQHRCFSKRCCR